MHHHAQHYSPTLNLSCSTTLNRNCGQLWMLAQFCIWIVARLWIIAGLEPQTLLWIWIVAQQKQVNRTFSSSRRTLHSRRMWPHSTRLCWTTYPSCTVRTVEDLNTTGSPNRSLFLLHSNMGFQFTCLCKYGLHDICRTSTSYRSERSSTSEVDGISSVQYSYFASKAQWFWLDHILVASIRDWHLSFQTGHNTQFRCCLGKPG